MPWYNPLSWFGRQESQGELALYCDNHQCRLVIEEDKITYDEEHREIYHIGECGTEATVHRAFKSGSFEVQNVDYISREKALKLLQAGKLSQSKKLEERV